jgi:phosphoribosylamine--glycine ligase
VKVLVVGAGGREHALVRTLARSPQTTELLCAPGNAGIARDARLLDIAAQDIDGIVAAVERERVDLTVVGPEAPLVAGLVDALAERARPAFGPSADAARLEGSKAFAKRAMAQAGVPTARWRYARSLQEGIDAVAELAAPGVVVKADGLAAGKGVTVADSPEQARRALQEIFLEHRFGAEQASAVVEERLSGTELSLLALCDGRTAVPLAPARDFKRLGDGDQGPNTGGMGAYSPVTGLSEADVVALSRFLQQPIVDWMRDQGTPYHGILYAGLMLTADGPRVLEFNVRFGDPETQAVLPRLRSDLLDLLQRSIRPGVLKCVVLG